MRYAALITLRCLDALHDLGVELTYFFGTAYWMLRRRLICIINGR